MSITREAARTSSSGVTFREPELADGKHLWRMAKNAETLDLNSPYAYFLFGGPFSGTCVVAETDDQPVGFVIGFRPPRQPDVLFVWQVAVDASQRGKRLASQMIDELVVRLGVAAVEATVTPSNAASVALFRSLAKRWGVDCRESPFLQAEQFPERGHEAEVLFHIGPLLRKQ